MYHNILSTSISFGNSNFNNNVSSELTRFNAVDILHNRGVTGWLRGVPYLALLHEYLKEFLPIATAQQKSLAAMSNGLRVDTTVNSVPPTEQDATRKRYGELFVQLAVQYWIDLALVVKANHQRAGVLRKLMNAAAVNNNTNTSANG